MTPLAIDLFCGLGGWTEGLPGYRLRWRVTSGRHIWQQVQNLKGLEA